MQPGRIGKRYFFTVILALPLFLRAQETFLDSLDKRMLLYSKNNALPSLFLHFDKTVYTPNELAWFTGYLLGNAESGQHRVLSVSLVSAGDKRVILEKQFLMSQGISYGELRVPDTLSNGRYLFLAYTDRMKKGEPDQVFTQAITVKTVTEPPFSAALRLVDSVGADGFYKVRFEGFTPAKMLFSDAQLIWRTMGSPTLTQAKTDSRGEYLFKIPVASVNPAFPFLETRVIDKKESRLLKIRLPSARVTPLVKILPEGGHQVVGNQGIVVVETLSPEGLPVIGPVYILEDGLPVDSMLTNSFGVARFITEAKEGKKYAARVGNTDHQFPEPLPIGPSLSLRRGVAEDTLMIVLFDKQFENVKLLVHDYRNIYVDIAVNTRELLTVRLPLTAVPRGLMAVTLLDDEDRPYAERLFFAHYTQSPKLTIGLRDDYVQREKVTVTFDLTGPDGNLLPGLFSVACVQENRLETVNLQDIETFWHLRSRLADLPADPTGGGLRSTDYLENMLITKGWRRYTWPALMRTDTTDTTNYFTNLEFSGQVTRFGKPLKKPAQLTMVSGNRLTGLQTDASGKYTVMNEAIASLPESQRFLVVNGQRPADYQIIPQNPYLVNSAKLAKGLPAMSFLDRTELPRTESLQIPKTERTIELAEVKLTTRGDRSVYGTRGPARGPNDCGDYVCRKNYLNCVNHAYESDNVPPKEGHVYRVGYGREVYKGCILQPKRSILAAHPGIFLARDFYGADYAVLNPLEPDYVSTLYWQHSVKPDSAGKASISFYAGDITGRFTIIAQGIMQQDVVYARKSFIVKRREENK